MFKIHKNNEITTNIYFKALHHGGFYSVLTNLSAMLQLRAMLVNGRGDYYPRKLE